MIQKSRGFTIVELLIVIVVIAILAALSYVGYSSIYRRANNTAIINAAGGSSRLIASYIASHGVYPYTNPAVVTRCLTGESGCHDSFGLVITSSTSLDAEIIKVGKVPQSVPNKGVIGNGIVYQYVPGETYKGQSQPLGIVYWLNGHDQDCGLPNVLDRQNQTSVAGDKTRCKIVVSGPGHS